MGFKPRVKAPRKERKDPAQINIYMKNIERSRAAHNVAIAKVTYTLVGLSYVGLKELRKKCGHTTDQKLVQHALAKFAWFSEKRDEGFELQLKAPDGTTRTIPWRSLFLLRRG